MQGREYEHEQSCTCHRWIARHRRGDLQGLKDAGYTVAANYAGNDEAAAKFKDETGIAVYKWSVADYDACKAGIAQVEADLGPVDMLVNNAGITRDAMFHRMTPEQWNEVIDDQSDSACST